MKTDLEPLSDIGRNAAGYQLAVPAVSGMHAFLGRKTFACYSRRVLIITAAAMVLALPTLIYGPMQQGHDTFEHLNYSHHFGDQFWSGELYPRWLIGMNHGLGSPTLFVYPPLPSYVYSFLERPARLFHVDGFRIGELLALLASGICAFLWMTTMFNENIATVMAILYMLMPYHLSVDFYRRTALSECWALAWMPLILYFAARATRAWGLWLVGLAVAYAMLILSHLVSVFIFSWVPLVVAFAESQPAQRLKSIVRIGTAMLLGTGISCFYFLSALAHAKYFPVSRLPLWNKLGYHLLTAGRVFQTDPEGFLRVISFAVLDLAMICVVCGLVIWAKGSPESKSKILLWLPIVVFPLLLMHGRSALIWRKCPALFAAIQYPWRLNIILCIASLPIIATLLTEAGRFTRGLRITLYVFLFLLIGPWLLTYTSIWNCYQTQTAVPKSPVDEDDGWFPAWTPQGLDQTSALKASMGPRARFVANDGEATVLKWEPRHIEIATESKAGGLVMINQFYYPAWRIGSNGESAETGLSAKMPEGLIQVRVPPGSQKIQVQIPVGRAEQLGWWISGLSLILALALAWKFKVPQGTPHHTML
jgi:hypothetical protein